MGLIKELENIISRAESEYLRRKASGERQALRRELLVEGSDGDDSGNRFVHCDNLSFLASGISDGSLTETIDMIYCDPPFFTGNKQEAVIEVTLRDSTGKTHKEKLRQCAYQDSWNQNMAEYLEMLAVRLYFMRDALKETGTIFLHLDWHAVHGAKLIMDEIFGEENFLNEIIWAYKSGGAAKRHFSRKHDTILFYAKSGKYNFYETEKEKSYNRNRMPYKFKGVEEFQDENGWYTLVHPKDVWQMDMLGRSAAERLNYATQKPEQLLAKMIRATTQPGDLCADFFCGSGTLGAAAAALDRRFLCVDAGALAISKSMKRPLQRGVPFSLWSEVSYGAAADEAHFSQMIQQLRPSERQRGGELLRSNPTVFDDYEMQGSMDETGCFFPEKITFFEGEAAKTTELPQRTCTGRTDGSTAVLSLDLFGNRTLRQETEISLVQE